MSKIPIAI
jgi:hypothetical protein